ncbi:MAG TPA: hypothetical protein VND88_13745 [Candidatus Acidoferrales bacterium]|nr:hypothetical protein [Candidatus Acidoferrales bacterium]
MRPNTWRAVIPCAALITLPVLASCGSPATPPAVAKIASAPQTAAPTPVPTATPIPGPPIGDACVVGTWRVVKGTFAVAFKTKTGATVDVSTTGGAGLVEHLFSNGTAVEDLGGTPFSGSSQGYRVEVRTRGELRSPVVFLNGYETIEPIDLSGAHATISINGGATQALPLATYGVLAYTCSATSLTENDGNGTAYTYSRTSTTP